MFCFIAQAALIYFHLTMSHQVTGSFVVLQVVLKYTGTDLQGGAIPPNAQEQIDLLLKLYKHTLKRAELRDELFAQLSKQTRNNADR